MKTVPWDGEAAKYGKGPKFQITSPFDIKEIERISWMIEWVQANGPVTTKLHVRTLRKFRSEINRATDAYKKWRKERVDVACVNLWKTRRERGR